MPGKGKPFVKGQAKGKPKGAETKVKKAARELFIQIMEGEVENIKHSLDAVRRKNPYGYIDLLTKMFPYFMPKKVDITSDGKELLHAPIIEMQTVDGSTTT